MELHVVLYQRGGVTSRATLHPASSTVNSSGHCFLEHDPLGFELKLEGEWLQASLMIGDAEIDSSSVMETDSGTLFRWEPKFTESGVRSSFFHNYFGRVQLSVAVFRDNKSAPEIVVFESVEVLARQVTADRVEKMLGYILQPENAEALSAVSPLQFGATVSADGIAPCDFLTALENTVSRCEIVLQSIVRNPLTKVRLEDGVISSGDRALIDDQACNWMIEHLGEAHQTDDRSKASLRHGDKWYEFNEVQAQIPQSSTDIYENQFIHSFVRRLAGHVESFKLQVPSHQQAQRYAGEIPYGYVSLEQLMGDSGASTQLDMETRLSVVETQLRNIRIYLRKHLPASDHLAVSFRVTEKMRDHRSYIEMMNIVRDWAEEKHVQWQRLNPLASINNAAKLFEVYSVLAINKHLHAVSGSTGGGLFNGMIGENHISLLYELAYLMPHGKQEIDSLAVNSDLEKRYDAVNNKPGKLWRGEYDRRTPDITLSVANGAKRLLWILDAKYKSATECYQSDLPNCTMKYFHGIHRNNGEQIVKGVFIIHPQNDEAGTEPAYLDYHAHPYHLYGESPVMPALGTLALPLSEAAYDVETVQFMTAIVERSNAVLCHS